jgi:hypothetical protein
VAFDPTDLKDNEAQTLENFVFDEIGALKKRKGYKAVDTLSANILGLGQFRLTDGTCGLLISTADTHYKATPSTWQFSAISGQWEIASGVRPNYEQWESYNFIATGLDAPVKYDGSIIDSLGTYIYAKETGCSHPDPDTLTIRDTTQSWVSNELVGEYYVCLEAGIEGDKNLGACREILWNDDDDIKIKGFDDDSGCGELTYYSILSLPMRSVTLDSGDVDSTSIDHFVWDSSKDWKYGTKGFQDTSEWGSNSWHHKVCYVEIVSGTGKYQVRQAWYNLNKSIYVILPWNVEPDSSSDYIIYEMLMPRGEPMCTWQNRLFLSDDSGYYPLRVWYSETREPDNFPFSNYLDIPAKTGERVIALKEGSAGLVVYTQNSMYLISGDAPPFSVDNVSEKIGTVARKSVISHNKKVYSLWWDGLYVFDNVNLLKVGFAESQALISMEQGMHPIGSKIDDIIKDVDRDEINKCVGTIYDDKYFLSIPSDTLTLIWDLKIGGFTEFDFAFTDMVKLSIPTDTFELFMSNNSDNKVFVFDNTFKDKGSSFTATYTPKEYIFGAYDYMLDKLWLDCTKPSGNFFVKFYVDRDTTTVDSVNFSDSLNGIEIKYLPATIQGKSLQLKFETALDSLELRSWGWLGAQRGMKP